MTHPHGARQLLAYFAATLQPAWALPALPEGYELFVSRANGRLYARRALTNA